MIEFNNFFKVVLEEDTVRLIINHSIKYNIDVYFVGGIVRDFFLNGNIYKPIDIDLCSSNSSFDNFFDIKHEKFFSYSNGKNITFNQFRKEKLVNNKIVYEPTECFISDALRRDFTINALYIHRSGKLIDFFNSIKDIQTKSLKLIDSNRFFMDATRLMRGIRYCIKFNLHIASNDYMHYNEFLESDAFLYSCIQNKDRINRERKLTLELFNKLDIDDFISNNNWMSNIASKRLKSMFDVSK